MVWLFNKLKRYSNCNIASHKNMASAANLSQLTGDLLKAGISVIKARYLILEYRELRKSISTATNIRTHNQILRHCKNFGRLWQIA
jgi:hypothetical protein